MDFTLVAPLVLLVCFGVAQLALWVVQRAEARSAAFEAARAGAVAPGSLASRLDVARRTASAANGSTAGVTARIEVIDGVRVVAVDVPVRMALLGWDLPLRSAVSGHVPVEPA